MIIFFFLCMLGDVGTAAWPQCFLFRLRFAWLFIGFLRLLFLACLIWLLSCFWCHEQRSSIWANRLDLPPHTDTHIYVARKDETLRAFSPNTYCFISLRESAGRGIKTVDNINVNAIISASFPASQPYIPQPTITHSPSPYSSTRQPTLELRHYGLRLALHKNAHKILNFISSIT